MGQGSKHEDKRRASRKIYCDIKYLCNYSEKKGMEAGVNVDDRSLDNVHKTFVAAEKEIHGPAKRRSQLNWGTVVRNMGKKLKSSGDNTAC